MSNFGFWDLFLWMVATYVAVVALVRLMCRRRGQVVSRLRGQIEAEQTRRTVEERARKRREAKPRQVDQYGPRHPTPAAKTEPESAPAKVSDAT